MSIDEKFHELPHLKALNDLLFIFRNCWQNYVDYYRCINKRGEDYEPCQFFWKNYNTICPLAWVERWNDQRENGTFPAKL